MYSHADRFPMTRSHRGHRNNVFAVQPWGVYQMAPYPDVIELPEYSVTIDPETKIGRYVSASDGVIKMKHNKSNTGTEQRTRASKGDGKTPKTFDDDTSQDSDQD